MLFGAFWCFPGYFWLFFGASWCFFVPFFGVKIDPLAFFLWLGGSLVAFQDQSCSVLLPLAVELFTLGSKHRLRECMPLSRCLIHSTTSKTLTISFCWICTVENLYQGYFCTPTGLEISLLVFTKASPKLQFLLEEVTAVHSKNCQVIVLSPEGLSNSITRANLKPTKRKHKFIPLQFFGGSFLLRLNWCLKCQNFLDCTKLLLGAHVFIGEELHSL